MVISVDALTQTETRQSTSLKIHDILILEIKKGNICQCLAFLCMINCLFVFTVIKQTEVMLGKTEDMPSFPDSRHPTPSSLAQSFG